MVPTPSEILKLVLFYSNPEQDFQDLIDKANENILTCIIIYDISHRFNPSTLALSSLLVVLDELNYVNFSAGLVSLIMENGLPFDFDEVLLCKNMLVQYLQNTSGEDH